MSDGWRGRGAVRICKHDDAFMEIAARQGRRSRRRVPVLCLLDIDFAVTLQAADDALAMTETFEREAQGGGGKQNGSWVRGGRIGEERTRGRNRAEKDIMIVEE
eukprot:746624-Hanusia_phi.AAC.1